MKKQFNTILKDTFAMVSQDPVMTLIKNDYECMWDEERHENLRELRKNKKLMSLSTLLTSTALISGVLIAAKTSLPLGIAIVGVSALASHMASDRNSSNKAAIRMLDPIKTGLEKKRRTK